MSLDKILDPYLTKEKIRTIKMREDAREALEFFRFLHRHNLLSHQCLESAIEHVASYFDILEIAKTLSGALLLPNHIDLLLSNARDITYEHIQAFKALDKHDALDSDWVHHLLQSLTPLFAVHIYEKYSTRELVRLTAQEARNMANQLTRVYDVDGINDAIYLTKDIPSKKPADIIAHLSKMFTNPTHRAAYQKTSLPFTEEDIDKLVKYAKARNNGSFFNLLLSKSELPQAQPLDEPQTAKETLLDYLAEHEVSKSGFSESWQQENRPMLGARLISEDTFHFITDYDYLQRLITTTYREIKNQDWQTLYANSDDDISLESPHTNQMIAPSN